MVEALAVGSVAGLGLYLLLRIVISPRPGVATLVARLDAGRRSMRTRTVTALEEQQGLEFAGRRVFAGLSDRLEVLAVERGWHLDRLRQDLAMLNRTVGQVMASKIVTALLLFVLGPAVWAITASNGVPLPDGVPVVVALALAALGFFLPDLQIRADAGRRRREFRRVVGVFLDLVAMNLAGGRGLPEALLAASSVSDHWSLVRIRQALANARLLGVTPWAALGELGDDLGVEELRDLSGALALASDDGAKIRVSLSARATSLRRKELAEAEGEAGERSQSMLVAQLLICGGFLVFLVYPAVSALLTQA